MKINKCCVCNKEYENHFFEKKQNKCIVHCDKQNWYTQDDDGIKDWTNSSEKIKYFWQRISKHIEIVNKENEEWYCFDYVVFPKFDSGSSSNFGTEDGNFYALSPFNNKNIDLEKKFSFEHSVFLDDVRIYDIVFKNIVVFDNSKFYGKFLVEKSSFNDVLEFVNPIFESDVEFKHCKFNSIFNNMSFEKFKEIKFFEVDFYKKVIFYKIRNKESSLIFHNVRFNESSQTEFTGIELGKLKIQDTIFNGKSFSFSESSICKYFEVNSSDLKNIYFNSLKLIKTEFYFYNASFNNSHFLNVRWGNLTKDRFEKKNISLSNRNIFRHLKFMYESQGDIITSNEFYALEMKEREVELEKDRKEGKNLFECLVFKIHGITSNHSQDWTLALFWIVIIGIITSFFNFYIMEDTEVFIHANFWSIFGTIFFTILIFFCNSLNKWKQLGFLYLLYVYKTTDILLFYVVKVINPFQKMTDMNLLDFMSKVIIGYLIYQLIISIRQNTRRK